MDDSPSVSIVVRAYNEEDCLPDLLDGIEAQTFDDHEVIVVDSGSYDRTPDIARERGARLIEIESRDFTFGYALNVGIGAARGDLIVIVSAHTRPVDEGWLSHLIAPLREDGTAMVYGRQVGTEESKFSEHQDFRRTFGPEREVLEPPNFFANNANSALRRELWERQQFDEVLPGLEDIAWAKHWLTRGLKVVYEPRAAIYHIHEESWAQVRRRYYREALAAKWIGIKDARDVPAEVAEEARRLLADLGLATVEGELTDRWSEIARFRLEKARGTVQGLRDGTSLGDPREQEAFYFDDEYRAVVIESPGSAELKTVERPPVKPGDVLIRVACVGVCATDLEIFRGTLGYYREGVAEYPIVPGHEFSGTVVKAGPNVDGVGEGDRVVAECIQTCRECAACSRGNFAACRERAELGVLGLDGAYAEYVVVPGHYVHRVPDGVGPKEAALCEPLAVVLKALERAAGLPGFSEEARCAVIGAGPIGHLAARTLADRGHRVTAFDLDRNRLERLCDASPRVAAGAETDDLSDFDLLVEATGEVEALERVLGESAAGSAVLLLGLPYGRTDVDFQELVAQDKAVAGSVGSGARHFEEALRLLSRLDLTALTGTTMPLSAFRKAWGGAERGEHLKVLLEPGPREGRAFIPDRER